MRWLAASLHRSSEQRRNRDKVEHSGPDRGGSFSGQGKALKPRFRPAAARDFDAVPALVYWLIGKEQRFLQDWRRILRFYMKVESGEEPVSGRVFAARR